jgi:hypothetical protein
VPAVGGLRNEGSSSQAQQVVGPHEPEHALGVDDEALVSQPFRQSPVTLVTALQRQTLDQIAQIRVVSLGELRLQPAIVAGSRKPRDLDEMRDARRVRIGFALRPFARHFFDDDEQMGASLARRFSSHDRKASRKKSRSAC